MKAFVTLLAFVFTPLFPKEGLGEISFRYILINPSQSPFGKGNGITRPLPHSSVQGFDSLLAIAAHRDRAFALPFPLSKGIVLTN